MQVMTIRLPKELHEQLRKEAFETNKSMNDIVLEEMIKRYKKRKVKKWKELKYTHSDYYQYGY